MKLRAVGGHTVRAEPQIDAGVAVNCFPELGKQPTTFQARPPLSQLSTHGYEHFPEEQAPLRHSPITGLSGTREAVERMLSASGHQVRLWQSPGARSRSRVMLTGMPGQRIVPVSGCCIGGSELVWVRSDGLIYYHQVADPTEQNLPISPQVQGFRAIGLAGLFNAPPASPGNAQRIWATCVEDRCVRAFNRSPTGYSRAAAHDLDLSETAIRSPESLWMDLGGSHMLVLDAIGGRILEFAYDPNGPDFEKWTLTTPPGERNPLEVQRLVGDPDAKEPVVYGGIHATEDEIRVVSRTPQTVTGTTTVAQSIVVIDRHTGLLQRIEALPDLRQGERSGKAVCGAVGGQAVPRWFVSGLQYSNGVGRSFNSAGLVVSDPMPDAEDEHPDPTPIVPFGDDGELMAWVVDRRLHMLDLAANRIVTNVEGNVDSVAYASRRLIACDASTGRLKVSPTNGVNTTVAERYGAPDNRATIQLPGWPRDEPRTVTSVFVGLRGILARTAEDSGLWRYDRANLSAPPVKLSGTANVVAVTAAGDRVAVVEQSTTGSDSGPLRVLRWAVPPSTPAAYAAPDTTSPAINRGFTDEMLVDVAASDDWLFVTVTGLIGNPGHSRLRVFNLTTGAQDTAAEIVNRDHAVFDGLEVNVPSWMRGITYVHGVLLMAIRQEAPGTTTVRALKLTGSAWTRARGRDLTSMGTEENMMLAHDARFVFGSSRELVEDALDDGTPVQSTAFSAFHGGLKDRLSKYLWDPTRSERTGAIAVAAVRRQLYVWTRTGMEIRDLADVTQGFPYALTATRTIGLIAPHSIALVNDVLHWLGTTAGGGLRVWRVGHSGDEIPDPIESKSIEEMLARMASDRNVEIAKAIGFGDDSGGHPTYVLHVAGGGVSIAYDSESDAWHCRSSTRADGDTPMEWPWLDKGQGVQRVTHSTTWRGRLVLGGYRKNRDEELAFASPDDWRDIDGEPVTRVRQFSGGEAERRRMRFPMLRVDAIYGLGGGATAAEILPRFRLLVSDDGGRNFRAVGRRDLGPAGASEPAPFYSLGLSRERVYRVECIDPVGFVLRGAYQEEPQGMISRKG